MPEVGTSVPAEFVKSHTPATLEELASLVGHNHVCVRTHGGIAPPSTDPNSNRSKGQRHKHNKKKS